MILVIGASGFLGSEICRLLIVDGQSVRAMVRESSDQGKTLKLEERGVLLVKGDLRDPSAFAGALDGVEVVITTVSAMPLSYVPGENDLEKVDLNGMKGLINSAKSAGVSHFIYTSFSINIDLDFPLNNVKREVENHLKNSGMIFTILRPGYFMEAWLTALVGFDVENAKAQLCGDGTTPVSYISIFDVAKFAVESIRNPAAKNALLELGGPDKVSQLEAVRIFEEVSGRKFEVTKVPAEALQSNMNAATDPMEKSFAGLMYCIANGDPIDMQETLQTLPVKLTSIREYARKVLS